MTGDFDARAARTGTTVLAVAFGLMGVLTLVSMVRAGLGIGAEPTPDDHRKVVSILFSSAYIASHLVAVVGFAIVQRAGPMLRGPAILGLVVASLGLLASAGRMLLFQLLEVDFFAEVWGLHVWGLVARISTAFHGADWLIGTLAAWLIAARVATGGRARRPEIAWPLVVLLCVAMLGYEVFPLLREAFHWDFDRDHMAINQIVNSGVDVIVVAITVAILVRALGAASRPSSAADSPEPPAPAGLGLFQFALYIIVVVTLARLITQLLAVPVVVWGDPRSIEHLASSLTGPAVVAIIAMAAARSELPGRGAWVAAAVFSLVGFCFHVHDGGANSAALADDLMSTSGEELHAALVGVCGLLGGLSFLVAVGSASAGLDDDRPGVWSRRALIWIGLIIALIVILVVARSPELAMLLWIAIVPMAIAFIVSFIAAQVTLLRAVNRRLHGELE